MYLMITWPRCWFLQNPLHMLLKKHLTVKDAVSVLSAWKCHMHICTWCPSTRQTILNFTRAKLNPSQDELKAKLQDKDIGEVYNLFYLEPETHTMDGFQNNIGIGFKMFAQLGDKYIHTAA